MRRQQGAAHALHDMMRARFARRPLLRQSNLPLRSTRHGEITLKSSSLRGLHCIVRLHPPPKSDDNFRLAACLYVVMGLLTFAR
jgi:hypothetical protein